MIIIIEPTSGEAVPAERNIDHAVRWVKETRRDLYDLKYRARMIDDDLRDLQRLLEAIREEEKR